jgi:calcium/calmodulin-dependent protein kinase (CaM kinase) II
MSPIETELLGLSEQLLRAIDSGDWAAYAALCDASITCFEPEACGQLVAGLPFHKFYFDLAAGAKPSPRQSTMASPQVRVMGDAAVVCYVRVVQKLDGTGSPVSVAAHETRVWQKQAGGWKHVHFHRSPV